MASKNRGIAIRKRLGMTASNIRAAQRNEFLLSANCLSPASLGYRHHLGVSLIEVLVSMLIVSVGVLGVTGMQLVSLHQNQSAMLRTEALMLGNDIIDRMHANPAMDYSPIVFASTLPNAVNCTTNVCSPTQMADYDIAVWKCSINSTLDPATKTSHRVCVDLDVVGSLPDGEASISKAGTVYHITVQWLDDRSGARRDISLRAQVLGL
jgi:type IV pilus assembly protein PilV